MEMTRIGNGQFWTGDCFEAMAQLPDASVDMIFTDPPYRTISGGTSSDISKGYEGSILEKNDGKIFLYNDVKSIDYLREFFRVLKPASHCYVMTNNLNLSELLIAAKAAGFGFHNLLFWMKNNCTANRWYMKNVEYVCFFYKKPAVKINNPGSKQVFQFDNIKRKNHPTEKPIELIRHYILNSSKEGGLVLDPFMGSGATAIAAEMTDRKWIGAEIDPEYAAKAIARIAAHVA